MKARDLGYTAVSVALLCVSAWVSVPVAGVPFTLQIAMLCLIAALLGAKRATLAVTAYILLGLVGVPVFASLRGGAGKLFEPTGGYIVGFLPLTIVIGWYSDVTRDEKGVKADACLAAVMGIGLLLCYVLGTVWFVFLSAKNSVQVGVLAALTVCVLPYIPLDIAKIFLAVWLTRKLSKFVK